MGREKSSISCFAEETLLLTCALWWTLWNEGQSDQRDSLFNSLTSFLTDTHSKSELHSVAPSFFLSESLDIFTIYWLCRYASSTKTNYIFRWELFLAGVVLWRKWMGPWGHEEQTLTFLYAAHPTWEQTAEFSKCPTAPSLNEGIR